MKIRLRVSCVVDVPGDCIPGWVADPLILATHGIVGAMKRHRCDDVVDVLPGSTANASIVGPHRARRK